MSGTAPLSLGRVAFLDDGTWRADPSGAPAVLIPVHDRDGVAVDIIAYHLNDPSEWRLRFGDECPILGAADLAQAAWYQEPVSFYSTPERWLIGRRRAPSVPSPVCILDWGVELEPLFEGVSRVECDSPELRDRFRKAIRSWEPKITAPRQNFATSRGFREARDAA